MESKILQFLSSKSLPSTIFVYTYPSSTTPQTRIFLPCQRKSSRLYSTTNSSGAGDNDEARPTVAPPETVEIRFKRGSRKRNKRQSGEGKAVMKTQIIPDPPKKWEDMSITEKAVELYMGEKGMLFWLNKFAYASIFIVIGGWILFRFVGPSLNLYQLDTPPLAPTNMFKGS
ncbi:hypothetical protein JCGZ_06522 [Jatropha curcas]|uniref:Transmembrane protein n=1 Tax=Jatropha curcas TaxID=180498 RepID=A0A067LQC1_JATCU|nr:uncharacterized protein LOC105628869 [Jatropha curcas]KDP46734.1 hypothetical protein JCGZ_06522 [Jatropha curcas]